MIGPIIVLFTAVLLPVATAVLLAPAGDRKFLTVTSLKTAFVDGRVRGCLSNYLTSARLVQKTIIQAYIIQKPQLLALPGRWFAGLPRPIQQSHLSTGTGASTTSLHP
jgi:hypothetical protein